MVETLLDAAPARRDYPIRPVPFTAVRCADVFWAPRIETNRAVTVPFALQKCVETGRVDNFRRAAAVLAGAPAVDRTPPGFPFDDTDLYKVIEGAAYTLRVRPDPALEAEVDGLVDVIASAQEPDGYLYPARTIDPAHPHPWAGTRRWELERQHSHELYNVGHLCEAAVAYAQATGKDHLLAVAREAAGLLVRTFGPERAIIWPGHQITELALVTLYRATGVAAYLDLARFLLDRRGPDGAPGSGNPYNQSHAPVVDQATAVGHAVRATYMYAGMADVAAVLGTDAYVAALDRIWADVVGTKLYLTGGIGATTEGEAFGPAYDLPNATAYSETCAAIGNVFWNQRMFLLHGEARYVDVLERTLYNALLAGVSLDGMAFFYDNPLESDGHHQRSPWFGCACCPGNIVRFLPAVPGYVYAQQSGTLYVNLFVAGRATVGLDGGPVVDLTQETRYPWDGAVRLHVDVAAPHAFTMRIRIPGWAREEVVPGTLYRFADAPSAPVTLAVNGQLVAPVLDRGYAVLHRTWAAGDVIALDLPMPVRRVVAHDAVAADQGKIALQRGPLVYCLESPDPSADQPADLVLADDAPLRAEWAVDLLGGLMVISGPAAPVSGDAARPPSARPRALTAIPYYAWANRGPAAMAVWIARRPVGP